MWCSEAAKFSARKTKTWPTGSWGSWPPRGLLFHLNAAVLDVRDTEHGKEVRIQTKEKEVATLKNGADTGGHGRAPNLGGLNLEAIGVRSNRKGIQVDNRMRTTQKHIYAAGDITGAYQFTHAAGYEGGIVLGNAVFHLPRKADYTFFPPVYLHRPGTGRHWHE